MTTELLNYVYSYKEELKDRPTLLLIHGLMGDCNNLGMIGRNFADRFNVLRVDLVNHGKSFYRPVMDYFEMAADVKNVVDSLGIDSVIPVGHSMGGKVAMRFAFDYPSYCKAVVVLDMAPVIYGRRGHDEIFFALNKVEEAQVTTSSEAKKILEDNLSNPGVVAFLLKSFTADTPHRFVFNAPVLEQEYDHIGIWNESVYNGPAAFIYGGDSPYLNEERIQAIYPQFPEAKLYCVEGATHWLHAEKPKQIFQYMDDFFESAGIL